LAQRSTLSGKVKAPGSKSITHRALVLSSLSDGRSTIRFPLVCDDTISTVRGLRALGVGVEEKAGCLVVDGTCGRFEAPSSPINLGNSGTSLRFLTVLAGLAEGTVILTGDESLRRRPMSDLLRCLRSVGVSARSIPGLGLAPIEVRAKGVIEGGAARIAGRVSSQFISAMLLPSAHFERGLALQVVGPVKSRPYVDLTVKMLREFGVEVQVEGASFNVSPGQMYLPREYEVEGDYSSAAFLVAAALVTGSEVEIEGLRSDTSQGDAELIRIVEKMGAHIERRTRCLRVLPGDLEGIEVDLSNTPDLLPPLAVIASRADGTTRIRGVEHARLKESDRISVLRSELLKVGVKVAETHDGLEIAGASTLRAARTRSHGDHRIAMALAVLGLCSEGILVQDAECISVSYPSFVEDLRGLGAKIRWMENPSDTDLASAPRV